MNILHVVPSLDPADGGPPRIALHIAVATARLGHAVTLVTHPTANRVTVTGDAAVNVEFLSPGHGRFDRLTGRSVRRSLAGRVGAFDVVHVHDVWRPISRAALAAADAAGVRFVLLPNGMLDPWSLRQKAWKKRPLLALGLRRLLNRAAFIHVGNADEERGVRLARITAPAVTVPNGVDPAEFDPPPVPRPELTGLGDKPYVLFLGRLHYKKGLDHLAAAFTLLAAKRPDVHLVVAGPDEGAAESFRNAIGSAGLSDRVRLLGPVFGDDRYALMAGAAAFCLPSRQEGFSIAILEALACGCPVVISDACHFPEVATAGAGEVVPLSADAVAAALLRVLNHPGEMRRAARSLVMSNYTWPRVAERLVEAYARR